MTNIVRFEELVIAGILQFGEIDQLDIELLKEWLQNNYDIEITNGRIICNREYIKYIPIEENIDPWLANKYFLNPDFSFESNVSQENGYFPLRKRLSFAQGLFLSEVFEKFSSDLFILSKIKKLPALSKNNISEYFCKDQLEIISNLQNQGYLSYYFNDDAMAPSSAFEQLYITNLGEAKLFIDDYKPEVERFCEQYGAEIGLSLLERYLSKTNLKKSPIEILNVESFDSYCSIYDDSVQETVVEIPTYKKAEKGWKTSKTSLIHELLTTCQGNTICFCHPNDLLKERMDLNINDVNIPWADIDVDTMEKYYDYRKFRSSEKTNALDYVICVLNGRTHYKKKTKFRYLTVMEIDSKDRCLVRGIIKSDENGFYVLLNPLFKEYLDSIKKAAEKSDDVIIKTLIP